MKSEAREGKAWAGRRSTYLAAAGVFCLWTSLYVYVPILPVYAQSLGASLSMVGLVVGAYGVTQALVRFPLGVWSDRRGRRKPFVFAGLLAAALGSLGLGLSPRPWLLALFRGVHGLAAATWVAAAVLFASYFPAERAVRAMGFATFLTNAAQVVATYSGGWLAQAYGWRAPFYAGVLLGLVGAACILGVAEKAAATGARPSLGRLWQVATAPTLLILAAISALLHYAVWASSFGFVPVYAAQLGASKADLGSLTTAMLVMSALATLGATFTAERLGYRTSLTVGMLLVAAAILAIPFLRRLDLLGLSQAAIGLGRGLGYPVLMGLSIQAVPQAERATAMGLFQAVYAVGMFAGPLVAGAVAEGLGLGGAFFATGLVCLVGAGLVLGGLPPDGASRAPTAAPRKP